MEKEVKEFKIGALIKTKWSTCMIIQIISYEEYINLELDNSFWAAPATDDMICIEVLHDKRKKWPVLPKGHFLENTFWIPAGELYFRADVKAGGDRWEVFGGS